MSKVQKNRIGLMTITVAILATTGVAAGIVHFFNDPYNPGFLEHPNVVKMHAALGAVYLALAPFQFLVKVRSRWPGYHRAVGRLLTSIGLVIGLSAIFIGLVIPYSGLSEQVVIGVFGIFFVVSLANAFLSIRNRDIDRHREWMIRAFSIGLSVATMRLIFIPALIIVGANDETARALSIFSFTISFALHATVAELWIRHTRHRPQQSSLTEKLSPVNG